MKAGDLLVSKDTGELFSRRPTLLILGIKKHPENSEWDKIQLQWIPKRNGRTMRGEFSRLIVEKNYEVLSYG